MTTPTPNDGGPAFPVPPDQIATTGDPRDGYTINPAQPGRTLRDWFAGMALGQFAHDWCECDPKHFDTVALNVYKLADAMLAARERKEGGA